jgi:hypothetical protein
MSKISLTRQERQDIKSALTGLQNAQTAARKSGAPLTVVENRQVIKVIGSEKKVLTTLPARRVVKERYKRASKRA